MTNLIKMEWYKLRTSKLFIILLIVTFVLNAIFLASLPMISSALGAQMTATDLSSVLASPFALGLLMIPLFISAVSFLYLDFSGGYIKNIAGQLANRGSLVFAKFIMIGVHNLIFFVATLCVCRDKRDHRGCGCMGRCADAAAQVAALPFVVHRADVLCGRVEK